MFRQLCWKSCDILSVMSCRTSWAPRWPHEPRYQDIYVPTRMYVFVRAGGTQRYVHVWAGGCAHQMQWELDWYTHSPSLVAVGLSVRYETWQTGTQSLLGGCRTVSGVWDMVDCYTVLAWWLKDCQWDMRHGDRLLHSSSLVAVGLSVRYEMIGCYSVLAWWL